MKTGEKAKIGKKTYKAENQLASEKMLCGGCDLSNKPRLCKNAPECFDSETDRELVYKISS